LFLRKFGVVKRNIEEPMAEEILKGTVKAGGRVRVVAPEPPKDDRLGIKVEVQGGDAPDAPAESEAAKA
jgi:hypothetical protein